MKCPNLAIFILENSSLKRSQWAHKEVDLAMHPTQSLVLCSVKNEILDLFDFITLVNELIKCDNNELNVCKKCVSTKLPTVSSVRVTISGLCKLTVIADKGATVQSTVVTKTRSSLISRTGVAPRLDLGLQRLLRPSWARGSAGSMRGEVSSPVFVTLGGRQL